MNSERDYAEDQSPQDGVGAAPFGWSCDHGRGDMLMASQSDAATVAVGFNPRIDVALGWRRRATLEYGVFMPRSRATRRRETFSRRDATPFR